MDKLYSVWLHKLQLYESIKVEMLNFFGDAKSIYDAPEESYTRCGLTKEGIAKIQKAKPFLKQGEVTIKRCEAEKIHIIDLLDATYPYYLKQIPDPPIVLFVKGNYEVLNTPVFGIVGARKCLEYGYQITCKIAEELASYGITVISGMAMGVDAAAHQGALKQGKTIAVLGTGLNICYPSCNRGIYTRIPENGCLVSEYDLDCEPRPYQFPKRNRIISGMAAGILVTEADVKSGSLITAQLALEYNRDVFAIPGDIRTKLSLGTNELIKQGAKCVTRVEDIIEELPLAIKAQLAHQKKNTCINTHYELAQDERIVYAYVSWEPIFLNELLTSTKLSCEAIYTELVKLEIKGLIKRLPGERYVRA